MYTGFVEFDLVAGHVPISWAWRRWSEELANWLEHGDTDVIVETMIYINF